MTSPASTVCATSSGLMPRATICRTAWSEYSTCPREIFCRSWIIIRQLNRKSAIANRKSKKVSHLLALGFQVARVVRIRLHANRQLLDDFQAVAFQPDRSEEHTSELQSRQYL